MENIYWAVIVLLVLVAVVVAARMRHPSRLRGVWACRPDFMDEAGLTEGLLYLHGGRGYLFLADGEEVLANQPLEVETSPRGALASALSPGGVCRGSIALRGGAPALPETLDYMLTKDGLTLHRGETAYLVLTRDREASEAALAALPA